MDIFAELLQYLAASVLMCLVLTLLMIPWRHIFLRWRAGEPILVQQPRVTVGWGLIDVLIGMGLLSLFSLVTHSLVTRALWPDLTPDELSKLSTQPELIPAQQQLLLMFWMQMSVLFAVMVLVIFILLRTRGSWRELGWPTRPSWHDVSLGAATFGALLIPVYATQILIHRVLPENYRSLHPLVEAITRQPDPSQIGWILVIAVVIAPAVEELLFRAFLQGWFRNIDLAARNRQWWLVHQPGTDVHAMLGTHRPATGSALDTTQQRAGWWPIVGSSFLFALGHQGFDRVPLFLLALGLGYLYERTGRLMPCIVVHALNNGLTSLVVFLYILEQS
jgi:membrane protease YdiL (CAAX protease family)